MEAFSHRRSEAEYGLRQHSRLSTIKSRTTHAAIAGISFFVASTTLSALSHSRQNSELSVSLLNMGLLAGFAARLSRIARDKLEGLLAQKHALHPVIMNKVFEGMKEELHHATHEFVQHMNDNDKGTLVVTE